MQELVDGVVNHGAAPDDRLFLILLEEGHGHHLHPPLLGGVNLTLHVVRLFGNSQNLGHIGAIDVHIQQSHPFAFLGQGGGQVNRHGSLADTTLAAVDADLGLNRRQALRNFPFLLPGSLDLLQPGVFLGRGLYPPRKPLLLGIIYQ